MSGRRRKQAMSRGVGEDDVRPFRAAQGSNRPSQNQCNPDGLNRHSLTPCESAGMTRLPRNVGDLKKFLAGMWATAVR